nr:5809_t:CDS:2 [Entrophospora candida]
MCEQIGNFYITWPSLYWPSDDEVLLCNQNDIRLFTIIWTIIFYTVIYGTAGIWAWIVFHKNRWSFLFPIGFIGVALLSGLLGGTIVGFVLGALYNFGKFEMSVWIPFFWGLIQALVALMGRTIKSSNPWRTRNNDNQVTGHNYNVGHVMLPVYDELLAKNKQEERQNSLSQDSTGERLEPFPSTPFSPLSESGIDAKHGDMGTWKLCGNQSVDASTSIETKTSNPNSHYRST